MSAPVPKSAETAASAAAPTPEGKSRDLAPRLRQLGRELGFDLIGIAPAQTPDGWPRLNSWLDQGYAGQMQYMTRRREAYAHPDGVLPGARSVIMAAINYKQPVTTGEPVARDETVPSLSASASVPAQVASYARGTADYHDTLKERLRGLADLLHQLAPGCHTRCVVDTAPLLERDFARLAGLGWFGKNTMLIHKRLGSYLLLGAVLTDLELEGDPPHVSSHCGTCTRCLEVCPTDAFPEPGVLDARRCISYLTIELKGSIPQELRRGMQDWMFGCDLCQIVCPWNTKPPISLAPEFQPQPDLQPADAVAILQADDATLKQRFAGTPLSRPGPVGLKRNAAIVIGNARNLAAIPALVSALGHPEAVVRAACVWALGELGGSVAREALQAHGSRETDPEVQDELRQAIVACEQGGDIAPAPTR